MRSRRRGGPSLNFDTRRLPQALPVSLTPRPVSAWRRWTSSPTDPSSMTTPSRSTGYTNLSGYSDFSSIRLCIAFNICRAA